MMRTYSQLRTYSSFLDRYKYLRTGNQVAHETFGHERWMNQRFYTSKEWRDIRTAVIARDLGNDLGLEGYPVMGRIQVHHMNPMKPEDLLDYNPDVLNPEYLITVSLDTHNAIHFGDEPPKQPTLVTRRPGDTTLW